MEVGDHGATGRSLPAQFYIFHFLLGYVAYIAADQNGGFSDESRSFEALT